MKANIDGYYESMRVGTADNLTPRGESSEEIIMSRTAGGNNAVESGDALIKSIRGNSLVYSQLCNFAEVGADLIKADGCLISQELDAYRIELKIDSSSYNVRISTSTKIKAGHKYLFNVDVQSKKDFTLAFGLANNTFLKVSDAKNWKRISAISQQSSDFNYGRLWFGTNRGELLTGDIVYIKNTMYIDLTQMFGTGNEPTTAEEFAHRLGYDSIEQIPYLPYNEGEIVSCNAEGIRTTDAEGDTYERSWATTLHEYFPRGLQSVGNVYDEITPNKAIKRISNNREILQQPEEYPYDELNLSMRVSPGGKEEAIIPKGVLSTPLRMDVVYPIDAYRTIVNNRQRIGDLSSLQTQAKTDLVSAINENNQLAKDAVLKTEQELTPEEQTQVQSNIGVRDTVDVVGIGEIRIIDVNEFKEANGYWNKNGVIAEPSSTNYFHTKPIPVNQGDIILLKNSFATAAVMPIVRVQSDNTFISVIASGDSSISNYSAIAQAGYISLSVSKSYASRMQALIIPCKLSSLLAEPAGGYCHSLYSAAGAIYDDGVWLLNGLELTEKEMAEVYTFGNLANSNGSDWQNRLTGYSGKTTIPYRQQLGKYFGSRLSLMGSFSSCYNLEILKISIGTVYPENVDFLLYASVNLRKVFPIIDMRDCKSANLFCKSARALEYIHLTNVKISLSFSDSPLLTVEDTEESTLGYLVANAKNTAPITVTLHADAYARVPESLKTKAQEKQISIVSE